MNRAVQFKRSGKTPLVLVHGWGMNVDVWQPIRPLLEQHFDVIAIELPGHGNAVSTTRDEQDWVDYCLQQAPVKALWLGWSLGGQIALQASLRFPERFLGLLLVATTPRFVTADDWPHAVDAAVFDAFGDALIEDATVTLMRFLSLQVRGSSSAASTLKKMRADFRARPLPAKEALENGLYLLKNLDLRARLGFAKVPVAWIFGQRDTLIPLEVANDIATIIPRTRQFSIDGGGHAPFVSHPDDCAGAVMEFVNDHGI